MTEHHVDQPAVRGHVGFQGVEQGRPVIDIEQHVGERDDVERPVAGSRPIAHDEPAFREVLGLGRRDRHLGDIEADVFGQVVVMDAGAQGSRTAADVQDTRLARERTDHADQHLQPVLLVEGAIVVEPAIRIAHVPI
jgi:hypothetical protein